MPGTTCIVIGAALAIAGTSLGAVLGIRLGVRVGVTRSVADFRQTVNAVVETTNERARAGSVSAALELPGMTRMRSVLGFAPKTPTL